MDFWEEYRRIVISEGVMSDKVEWFLIWARQFATSIKNVSLKERNLDHLKVFMNNLSKNRNIKPWQLDQAWEALRILYQQHLLAEWAALWPELTAIVRMGGDAPLNNEGGEADDYVKVRGTMPPVGKVNDLYADLIEKLRSEIRLRHYSIRTEEAYLHWFRRFVAFHRLKSPRELGPEAVRAFLDYQAKEREVSASTQNQAYFDAVSVQLSAVSLT